jgi:hypothetical protein
MHDARVLPSVAPFMTSNDLSFNMQPYADFLDARIPGKRHLKRICDFSMDVKITNSNNPVRTSLNDELGDEELFLFL